MATPAQIDEQIALERKAINKGLDDLRKNTSKLEARNYASASIYGATSIETLMPALVERIEETKSRIRERKNGPLFAEITKYLEPISSEVAAAITCKMTFDQAFGAKDDSHLLVNVVESIGKGIEREAQMQHYEQEAPGLLNTLKKKYWHKARGADYKVQVIQTLMNRYDINKWQSWGREKRSKLGGWLLDCLMITSGWFEIKRKLGNKAGDCPNYLVPSDHFMTIKDDIMKQAELFSAYAWPMLIEPNDWTEENAGGYLLNEVMRGHQMVRRGNSQCIQGEKIFRFLNHIQKVGYKVNKFILEVAETLYEKQYAVENGKFIPLVIREEPPKPPDIAENEESRREWRTRKNEVEDANHLAPKKAVRTGKTLEVARMFKDVEAFFLPWSLDYRGRAYPIPAFLTPQETDFGKSLLLAAESAFMTPEGEEWLKFQVATMYGLDKEPMAARIQWVDDNEKLIEQIATDPLGSLHEWEKTDEPFQFLAACREYYEVMIACTKQSTNLLIATDATCSGIQVLSGLARDHAGAKLTNVVPSDRPQDAYRVVADACRINCPETIQPFVDRGFCKRVVMTLPYNAKEHSNRKYIRDYLIQKCKYHPTPDELTQCVKAVRKAMFKELPGPMKVMKWIEETVAECMADGREILSWTTPAGFTVNQRIMKKHIQQVRMQIYGTTRLQLAEDGDQVDKRKHRSSTSPNLIHSLDSCLLHLAIPQFNAPVALIHDSVMCRATDMSTLSVLIREAYKYLFADNDYLSDWAEQVGAKNPPPIIGDLKPETVVNSPYFFC